MKKYLLMFLLTLLSLSVIPVFTLFAHISFEKYPSSDTGESSQTILVYNEKTDKMFDGAFIRPQKTKKEKPKEEPEPGYLRVKRKKQGKRKK